MPGTRGGLAATGIRPRSRSRRPAARGDGIQRGNEGIDVGTWTPPGEPERPTLPGHEHGAGKRRSWEDEA